MELQNYYLIKNNLIKTIFNPTSSSGVFYFILYLSYMKIIITETQSAILYLKRRIFDKEMYDLIGDIVIEGFDYEEPCEYIGNYNEYKNAIIWGSVQTFTNTLPDIIVDSGVDRIKLDSFIYKFIEDRFGKIIKDRYESVLEWGCDE